MRNTFARLVSVAVLALATSCANEPSTDLAAPTEAPPSLTQSPTATTTVTPEAIATPQPLVYDPIAYNAYLRSDGIQLYINRIPPSSIEQAEAEGELYRGGYDEDDLSEPSAELTWEPGSGASECVPVIDGGRTRSADWVLDAASDEAATLYPLNAEALIPEPREAAAPLVIRAAKVDGTRFHLLMPPPRWSNQASEPLSYPLPLKLPVEGTWVVLPTAGPNWGCFLFEVTSESKAPRPADIAAAEAAGAAHQSQTLGHRQHIAFAHEAEGIAGRPFGTEQRSCVDVSRIVEEDELSAIDPARHINIRSGDWIVSGWTVYLRSWDPRQPGNKLPFVPRHQEAMSDIGMTIVGTRLGGEGDPAFTFEYERGPGYSWGGEHDGPGNRFYSTGIVFPAPGRWLTVVTSGPNWGCFIFELPND